MRRFVNERNIYLLLSLLIATILWLYVTTARSPRVDRAGAKVVPVVPAIVGEPAYGYSLLGVRVTPTAVSITGDPSLLAPVQTVTTEPVNVSGQSHDVGEDVSVLTPPGIQAGMRVRVSVQIVPAVAVTVLRGVRIQVLDAPAGTVIDLQPTTIEVHVQGPVLLVTRLRAEQFTATIEAADLPIGRHRLPVKEVTAPPQVDVLDVHPAEIVVTIRRRGG